MSWVPENRLTWFQRFAINVIRCGPIPAHVAFIMDGNRRFATKSHLPKKSDGHRMGFEKLAEALQWCLDLGIQEVTVYAFSIENFKRSEEEVNTLMTLATEKFKQLLDEMDKLDERGICIRIVGNTSMLPLDLQSIMAEAMLRTQHNNKAILNVAFPYTSRDEITESIRTIAMGVQGQELRESDISDELIHRCMYTNHSPDPDLLVRTSGESRLSDFMLYQISTTIIYFTKTLWPEFTIWQLLAGIFYFQRHHATMTDTRRRMRSLRDERCGSSVEQRTGDFLARVEEQRIQRLNSLAIKHATSHSNAHNGMSKILGG